MSRALRRHHRERVIAARRRTAVAYYRAWRDFAPERGQVWPAGALADNQYWLGCNTARCGLCHPSKRWHTSADRMRAEREWRLEWEA